MNTILMAAARGARIETQYQYPKKRWGPVAGIRTDDFYHYRIHKDDEHLRFGPISSALREYAETGREPYTLVGLMAREAMRYELPYPFILKSEWPHAQMFALILSEALAEEGI